MAARLLFAGVFALLCLPLFLLPADEATLENLAVARLLGDDGGLYPALLAARETPDGEPPPLPDPLDPQRQVGRILLVWPGEADLQRRRESLSTALKVPAESIDPVDGAFLLPLPGLAGEETLEIRVHLSGHGELQLLDARGELVGQRPLGSRASLLPPLVAILLAFFTRRTIASLFLGVVFGAVLLVPHGESLFAAIRILFFDILGSRVLGDDFHLYILGFVLLLSATVAVVTRMGGIEGLVRALVRYAKSSRSVQGVAYFLGLGIFFDDYANTIVVGNSCGPLFDRMKVSRAKLAYVVDSTAAPVAGIAVLSTWVAYQISTYAPQLPTIGRPESEGYAIFLATIPYRFYCFFAIVLVGLTILTRREIGPMAAAEDAARAGRIGPGRGAEDALEEIALGLEDRARWFNGAIPILTMILATFALIVWYGAEAVAAGAAAGDPGLLAAQDAGGLLWLRTVLAESDSTAAIFYGSLTALGLACLLALSQRLLTVRETAFTATRGVTVLFKDAVLILVLAWTIGHVCTDLATANYLVAVFQDLMAPAWLPLVLFVTACFVAFSTGSSWTTMAILQPNVVLLADRLGEESAMGSETLLLLSIGAVLEGAIFGDHCSPISDTTILSSTASRCDHLEHVRTQAPYALLAAAVALLLGYIPVALLGLSPWISLATGAAAMFIVLRGLGRVARVPTAAA